MKLRKFLAKIANRDRQKKTKNQPETEKKKTLREWPNELSRSGRSVTEEEERRIRERLRDLGYLE